MIPKKIHYVWGYNEPKSGLAKACITSWKYCMPDYEIVEWNQRCIDFDKLADECRFFKACYERNMWAFMSDYIRLKVLYHEGGIYLDTDMQLFKSLDSFLHHRLFAGFHDGYSPEGQKSTAYVEAALLGAEPRHPFISDAIDFYQSSMHTSRLIFIPHVITPILCERYGLHGDNEKIQLKEDINLYPISYFFPIRMGEMCEKYNPETYTIHWFSNSYGHKLNLYLHTRHLSGMSKYIYSLYKIVYFYIMTPKLGLRYGWKKLTNLGR